MLKAKLDSVRKNKKGFSLVELIIVIAIMVALIAVMAPAFVKYVQRSRDSALSTAGEDFLHACQAYIADPNTEDLPDDNATITLTAPGGSAIQIDTDIDDGIMDEIKALAGVDEAKTMGKANNQVVITFHDNGANGYSATSVDSPIAP